MIPDKAKLYKKSIFKITTETSENGFPSVSVKMFQTKGDVQTFAQAGALALLLFIDYSALWVIFLWRTRERHPIDRPWVRGMEYHSWA